MSLQVIPAAPSVQVGGSITFSISGAAAGSSFNWQLYQGGKWGGAGCYASTYTLLPTLAQNGVLVGCNVTSGGTTTAAAYATVLVTSVPPPATKYLQSVTVVPNPATGGVVATDTYSDGSTATVA